MAKTNKVIISTLLAVVLFFGAANFAAADENIEQMLAYIQWLKRQIIIAQIQLVERQIYQLQVQLSQITINQGNQNSNAYIGVISPNGGETIKGQRGYYIRWESQGVNAVTIKLDDAGYETIIASNIPAAQGRYYWDTGYLDGHNFRIRIYDSANANVSAVSNGHFAVFDDPDNNRCSDGTYVGKCSTDKPKLCFDTEIDLTDACHSCGCPSGEYCRKDGTCY